MNREPADFSKIKDRALRLLARRDHSVRELKAKLRHKTGVDEATFERLISYLKEYGYLADEKDLAARWVRQWRSEGRGRIWISGKLKAKGLVPPPLKDDDDEIEAARRFLAKKLEAKGTQKTTFNERAKISRSMISRGFSASIVATVLGGVRQNESI